MKEKDAYLLKMESEKRTAEAKLAEADAQSDLAKAKEELDVVSGAKQRTEDFDRGVEALRRASDQDFERMKANTEKLRIELERSLNEASLKLDALREGYRRTREAELRQLGAQVDQWESSRRRTWAEDSLLTREELTFVKRSLQNTGTLLKNLGRTRGEAWRQAKREYESAWTDLWERSRRIRADGAPQEEGPASHP